MVRVQIVDAEAVTLRAGQHQPPFPLTPRGVAGVWDAGTGELIGGDKYKLVIDIVNHLGGRFRQQFLVYNRDDKSGKSDRRRIGTLRCEGLPPTNSEGKPCGASPGGGHHLASRRDAALLAAKATGGRRRATGDPHGFRGGWPGGCDSMWHSRPRLCLSSSAFGGISAGAAVPLWESQPGAAVPHGCGVPRHPLPRLRRAVPRATMIAEVSRHADGSSFDRQIAFSCGGAA
jgi:hypothetical protein